MRREKLADLYNKFLFPKSKKDDFARREFILNVLLLSSMAVIFFGLMLSIVVAVFHSFDQATHINNTMPLWGEVVILLFLFFLFILSRKGFFRLASYFLLVIIFLFAVYLGIKWGVDLPAEILFFSLLIVMSGVLISSRFAFLNATVICLTISIVDYLHLKNIIISNRYWAFENWKYTDIMMASVIFLVIATVSWLSNREIERALNRAKKSEADLKIERDNLEIKVEERTKELREAQLEKFTQINRLAEIGRLSSGIFHDLINPLNAAILNLEKAKSHGGQGVGIGETSNYLDRAISATVKMEKLVETVRKQALKNGNQEVFSLNEELRQVIDILSYKALRAKVEMVFLSSPVIETCGEAVKFDQIVLNLMANAIDSYSSIKDKKTVRQVLVGLSFDNGLITMTVRDYGCGIPLENIGKIFEPFFTTKEENGTGIGLSTVKKAVEDDFGGRIWMESELGKGTLFIVNFPKIYAQTA
jgi:signal transduction histidine kinase